MTTRAWSAFLITMLLVAAPAAPVAAGSDAAIIVSASTGQIMGKADWSGDRLALRLVRLPGGQEFRLEVRDPGGSVLLLRSFVTLSHGTARIVYDTTGIAHPPSYTVHIIASDSAVVVAHGHGTTPTP